MAPVPRPLAGLALLGRWSLTYYMLHQPVMIGALLAAGWLVARAA
jgi:peptidoglycan/LPS O-acetylase OafA/YrhL